MLTVQMNQGREDGKRHWQFFDGPGRTKIFFGIGRAE